MLTTVFLNHTNLMLNEIYVLNVHFQRVWQISLSWISLLNVQQERHTETDLLQAFNLVNLEIAFQDGQVLCNQ